MKHASADRRLDLHRLSPAERRVIDHALAGRSAREIAELLVLSEATVRSHLSRIYIKLDVTGQVELLARAAVPANLTRPDDAAPSAAAAGHAPGLTAPLAILLVGLTLLSVFPPVAVVAGPGLLIAGWLAGRRVEGSSLRAARPWLFVAGALITVWAAVVLVMLAGLLTTSGGSITDTTQPLGP